MESIQKSRGYVSDILKLLCLLVEYFLEETALWLLCSGRYRRGGHEVDVQVFDSVAASTLVNRSAVQERSWWETKLNLCACLGGRYLATSTGAPYAALGGLWAIIIITVAEKSTFIFLNLLTNMRSISNPTCVVVSDAKFVWAVWAQSTRSRGTSTWSRFLQPSRISVVASPDWVEHKIGNQGMWKLAQPGSFWPLLCPCPCLLLPHARAFAPRLYPWLNISLRLGDGPTKSKQLDNTSQEIWWLTEDGRDGRKCYESIDLQTRSRR